MKNVKADLCRVGAGVLPRHNGGIQGCHQRCHSHLQVGGYPSVQPQACLEGPDPRRSVSRADQEDPRSGASPIGRQHMAQPKPSHEGKTQENSSAWGCAAYLWGAHDSVAPIVQPACPRLRRWRQASFGSCVCGHLDGILSCRAGADPAVVLRHLPDRQKCIDF